MAVNSIAVSEHLTVQPGATGTVVESTVFGRPRRVRFVLHNDAGEHEVVVDVRRGDVV